MAATKKSLTDIEDMVDTVKSAVISASRRTDIPAFYMNLIMKAFNDGYIDVCSPYGKISKISLQPKDVKCIVWWSKNYEDWINKYNTNTDIFARYKHMFNFTITGGDELETGVNTSLRNRLHQLKFLSETFGPNVIKLRFDPVVHYIDMNTGKNMDNLCKFERIVKYASRCGIKTIVFSFCIPYKKVVTRMKKQGKLLMELSTDDKHRILDNLIAITDKFGITLNTCCESDVIGYKNKIYKSKCVDGDIIKNDLKLDIKNVKDKGQRDNCNCVISRDIGSYTMKCKHSCVYCYANPEL